MAVEGAASASSHTIQHASQTSATRNPPGYTTSHDITEAELQKMEGRETVENESPSASEKGTELEAPHNLCDVPLIFIHGMKGCTLVHKETKECAWLKGNMAVSSSFSPLSLELPLDIKDGVQVRK